MYLDGGIQSKIKVILAIILALSILVVAFLGSLGAEFGGGKREVISKSVLGNYIAYELEPKMYEGYNTLIVERTMLNNFISKNIFETTFTNSTKKYNCEVLIADNNTSLKYDLCNHNLSIR
jgi:hypothetical protein